MHTNMQPDRVSVPGVNMPNPTFIFFILALLFINVFFGYQILVDLKEGYEPTFEKLLSIGIIFAIIVLVALLVISYQLLANGYRLADIKRLHVILKEEDTKRQKDPTAKLKWGLVDWILWVILAANGAILFFAHLVLIGLQILDLAAICAAMLSGVMLYAPLVFLLLYPIGKLGERTFPFSPPFFLSLGFICLILTLMSYEKLEKICGIPCL